VLFRLSHKRTYFFWPVCCRVLFRLHQVYFFNVCHCFFRLFFFLHGRVRVVVATWATLVGCSCSTSMLSYALLACLLLFYLHSFPAIVKIIEFVFFFPCFVLSLFFSIAFGISSSELWRYFFQASVVVIFYALFALLSPPLQLFALHVIWFYSVSNTLNNSYFFCLSVGITLFARLCFGLLTHLLCHFQSWSVCDV